MRKRALLITLLSMILTLNLISAISLDVSTNSISDSIITELNQPAIFDLTIRNLGESSNFEIYSLVGVDLTPIDPFPIDSGQTKTIRVNAILQEYLKSQKGPYTFEYKIKNSENEVQKEKLTIGIFGLENTLLITPQNINPNSKEIILTLKNKASITLTNLDIKITSAFFDYEKTIELKGNEIKEIQISLNQEKIKSLLAGSYLMNTEIKINNKNANIESIIKFLEKEGIETTEIKEGFLIKRDEIIKTNVGNIPQSIKITTEKNIISYLFTTFNYPPEIERTGFKIKYTWGKELIPNEELKLVIKTNWLLRIIIIVLIIGLFILIKRYVDSNLILTKKVSFVRTKGGEFALKVTLKAKAKNFIEKIHIIDKIPHLVKLYEKFGAISPDKIDMKNRRIEWNVESLNKDEERIFSYIVYSKIGIVGRFELPSAKAIYEKQGKIKEAESNRSFFINEPKK